MNIMTKVGHMDNVVTYEHVCDKTSDLNKIEPVYRTLGSVAIVIQGNTGFEVYMANSKGEWISIGAGGSSSDDEEDEDSYNQVTINLTNPISNDFVHCKIYSSESNKNITGTQIGQIESSTGSTTIQVSKTMPYIFIKVQTAEQQIDGPNEITYTGGVSLSEPAIIDGNNLTIILAIADNGSATLSGINYDG